MPNKKRAELEFIKGYGQNYKAIREKAGLTLVELGKIINYSDKTISLIETEQRTPTIEQINVYRSKFKVSLDYLTGHTKVSDVSLSQICDYTGLSETALKSLNGFYIQDKEAQRQTGTASLRMDFINTMIKNGDLFRLCSYLELLHRYSDALINCRDIKGQYDLNEKCDLTQLQITRMVNMIMDRFDEREIQNDAYIEILKNVNAYLKEKT